MSSNEVGERRTRITRKARQIRSRDAFGELRDLVGVGCPGTSIGVLDVDESDRIVAAVGRALRDRWESDVLSSVWVRDARELAAVVDAVFGRLGDGDCLVGTSRTLDSGFAIIPRACAFNLLAELSTWDGDEIIVVERSLRWFLAVDVELSERPGRFHVEFWLDPVE